MKKVFLTLVTLMMCQITSVGALDAFSQTVEFYTPSTVRIVKASEGAADFAHPSFVVVAKPEKVKVSRSEKGGAVVYKSSALTVTVKDGKVSFSDNKGNMLMTEGETAFSPITAGPDKGAFKVKQTFSLDRDEEVYGVGLLQNGKLSQRGENRRMEQTNLEDYAHFYQSIKGYGIYWDNYSPTRLVTPDEGEAGFVELESEVGMNVDYYFIYGGAVSQHETTADGVIKEMRHLTGKAPMLPLWTYGFHQSRERYKSQQELLDVVHKYRDLKIPFDGIIQDWQYWGSNYTWNAMDFLSEGFKKPQDMIDEVHKQNAHLSISIWQGFGPETIPFKELDKKGLMFHFQTWPQSGIPFWPPRMDYPSGVRVINPYSSEARDIYWKYLSKMYKMGIDAWWMDSTDPDHHSYKDSDLDELCTLDDTNNSKLIPNNSKQVSYRSVRNVFPLMAVGGVYDHQRAEMANAQQPTANGRVFILTRSYFAGQQRYGANTWSGDITSSWDSFRKQIPICLNYTLTACPQVNTDIGGFFAGSYNKHWGDNTATKNPQFQELYVRWMQFGAFCPMMRSHGTEVYRELYYYGKQGEPVYDALVDAVKLRYRFMPYIYSQAWQVTKNDDSFMRALFMDFKADKQTWNNNREYMFGHNILVCPVVDPLFTPEKKVKTDAMTGWDATTNTEIKDGFVAADWSAKKTFDVYLPAGAKWYDFWSSMSDVYPELAKGGNVQVEAPIDGGQTINADAPLSHSPLYIKAGTILPQGPDVQYTSEKKWDDLDIIVFPGADAEFTLYEDEGDNYNYEKGAYTTIQFVWNDKSHTLTIGKRNGSYNGMLTSRKFNVRVVGGTNKDCSYDGKKISVKM